MDLVLLFLSFDFFSYNYALTCFNCFGVVCRALRENDRKLGKLAMVGLPTGVFTLGPTDDASAGRIGGTIGSHCFCSSTPTTKRRAITKKPK